MTHDRAHPSEVLDAATLDRLARLGGEGGGDLLIELIDIFVDDATERVRSMISALAAGDLVGVEQHAHTLKSSSANMGALGLSELCQEIEAAVHRDEPVGALVSTCERMIEDVLLALRDHRRGSERGR